MESRKKYLTIVLLLATFVQAARGRALYDNVYISPDHVVLSAAICKASCYYRCLHKHGNTTKDGNQMPADQVGPESPTNIIEERCKKHQAQFISSCTLSCEFAADAGSIPEKCISRCPDQDLYCKEGCGFLGEAIKTSLGSCPETQDVYKPIDQECHLDQQCITEGDVRKCCNLRCVVPKYHTGIGPSLWPPTIMEGKDGSSFEMTWKYDDTAFSDSLIPVLFVLQVRTQFNKDFESTKASSWKTLLITFRVGVHLQDLQPGMWYQFRVASVTTFGTRGFKSISPPVRLSRVPREPESPRNLSDGAWRIGTNGNINIQILWVEPLPSDIPVTEYKISWVRDHGFIQPDGQSLEALTDFVQTVPGTQKKYDIEGLLPDKTYKVQVRALSKWGSTGLTSNPNTIFLTTPALPIREAQRIISKESTSEDDACMCQRRIQDPRIVVGSPIIINNFLYVNLQILNFKMSPSYKIFYTPRVCIDSEALQVPSSRDPPRDTYNMYREKTILTRVPNVTLGPIQFSCRYKVLVKVMKENSLEHLKREKVVDEEEFGAMTTCFCTPSCETVLSNHKGRDQIKLHCIIKATPSMLPPPKIFYQKSQKSPQSFLVFWPHPYIKAADGDMVTSVRYRVIWGPSIDDHLGTDLRSSEDVLLLTPRVDMSKAETKVLKENVSSIWLENLQRNKYYVIIVQALLLYNGAEQISPKKMLVLSTHKDSFQPNLSLYASPSCHRTNPLNKFVFTLSMSFILYFHLR